MIHEKALYQVYVPLPFTFTTCIHVNTKECALSGDANRRRLFLRRNPNPDP